MNSPPPDSVQRALEAAATSGCSKSKRGCSLIYETNGGRWRTREVAYANQPFNGECAGTDACRAACARRCFHAEAYAAVEVASCQMEGPISLEAVHVKLAPGKVVAPSGPPSCADCAKALFLAGAAAVWLFHADGWRRYPIDEFLALSIAAGR